MKSLTLALLTLLGVSVAISLTIFFLIEFRDQHSVLIERIDPNTYITSDLPKLLYANSLTNHNLELFNLFGNKGTYECLNGKDPSKMSTKEQLLEFIKGPCLPAVAVPGLIASRLSVKIDCETLQANSPDIFQACGWSSCSSWKLWQSKPKSEYDLWISSLLGPVSLIFPKTVECWGNLIQLNYNESEVDIARKFISPAGVEVKIYKQEELDDYTCGFAAINDIMPLPVQTGYTKGFKGIYDSLTKMGYQTGLTLHAAPYDWRKTTLANGITEVLNQTIRQIYQLTGKPTILMAHSLGNFGALHFLNSLTAEEKSKYIANYVSITNPLAGSPKTVKSFIGGDKEYVFQKYGIDFYAQRMLLKDNSAAFDLVPKDIYDYFANSAWLQEWKIRSNLEDQNDVRTPQGRKVWEEVVAKGDLPYKWFPSPLINCSMGFEQRRDECGLYMYNWSSKPLAIVNQNTFTASEQDMRKLFNEYALTTNVSDQLFEDSKTNNIRLLINPEVPVTLIYGSHLSTEMTFNWGYDPRNDSREDQFAVPNTTIYSQGDQTVPTSSALLPGLKWSWEFDNKEQAGVSSAKPVKVVEICSIYNNKGNIYDNTSDDAPYAVNNNEYIGLQCDCFTNKNDHPVLGQSCDHGDILNDSKFLDFVTKIVNANYKVANPNELVSSILSEDDLKNISRDCPRVGTSSTTFVQILATRPNITLLTV